MEERTNQINKTRKTTSNTKSSEKFGVEQLKKQNKELENQVKTMQDQMQQLMTKLENLSVNLPDNQVSNNFAVISHQTHKDIEVVSLSTGHLLLSTNGRSDGRIYEFSYQFESKFIPEEDLRLIVHAMPNTSSGGHFYIKDRDFVESNGLRIAYNNMLDIDKLKHILNKDVKDFENSYKLASKVQQETIVDMVIDRLLYGKKVDANIVLALEKMSGKKLMSIEPIVEKEE